MKTEKNIFFAFILNLLFSVFEGIGGALCGSVAIISDALHDLGDALSIGISWFLERKSRKVPDDVYTYGYIRFSVMGSLFTTLVLLLGSAVVIYNAVLRITNPVAIDYDRMLLFAVIGTAVNLLAAMLTKDGHSMNQKAVNLHMLEDVLGWSVILIGAAVMRFTDFAILDPLLSIGVSVFILINAIRNLGRIESLFLEKMPAGIQMDEIRAHILRVDGILDVHHIHIWSIDGYQNYATMHIVTEKEGVGIKEAVRKELSKFGVVHVTLELEKPTEHCHHMHCHAPVGEVPCHHHHHAH